MWSRQEHRGKSLARSARPPPFHPRADWLDPPGQSPSGRVVLFWTLSASFNPRSATPQFMNDSLRSAPPARHRDAAAASFYGPIDSFEPMPSVGYRDEPVRAATRPIGMNGHSAHGQERRPRIMNKFTKIAAGTLAAL